MNKQHGLKHVLLISLTAVFLIILIANVFLHQSYKFQRWEITWDGLDADLLESSDGIVYDLKAAPNGEVWGCTDRGLIHYDGTQWLFETNALLHNASEIEIAPDGQVWLLNTLGQVFRYDGNNWQEEAGSERLKDLAFTPDGTLWAATVDGLFFFDGNTWQPGALEINQIDENRGLWTITTAPDGSLWAGNSTANQMIYHIAGQNVTRYQLEKTYGFIQSISASNNGKIWIYSIGMKTNVTGLASYDGKRWKTYTPEYFEWSGMNLYNVNDLDSDSQGNAWAGTSKGVCRFNGWFCQTFMKNESVFSVTITEDDTVWLGLINGVGRLTPR